LRLPDINVNKALFAHQFVNVLGQLMSKNLLRLALATALFMPTQAFAADLDVMPPPPPPPVEELRPATYDWTGFYAGVIVGASCIDGGLTDNSSDPATDWEMSGCGYKGGVIGGYNHQFDNWVVGLEADWMKSNDLATNEEAGGDFAFDFNHEVTLRGRWGYAADDTLLFLTGGAAWAQGNLNGIISPDPNDITAGHWGWTVGAGIEHALTDQFHIRLDYLYTRYSGENYSSTTCTAHCDLDVDFDNHEVRVGATWSF
jgi:outer membrane immunogenic protein